MTRTTVRACRLGAWDARDSKEGRRAATPGLVGILELRLDRVGVALLVVDAYTGTKQSLFVCVRFFGEQFFAMRLCCLLERCALRSLALGKWRSHSTQ